MIQFTATEKKESKINNLSDDGKRRLAVTLIQSREISKAARILTSQRLTHEKD